MKTRRIEKIVETLLLPSFVEFSVKRQLMYRKPIGPVLQGFFFEDSEYQIDEVYVWAFVLPLYVPRKHLAFTFGRRLRHRKSLLSSTETWKLSSASIEAEVDSLRRSMKKEGLVFIDRLSSPTKIANSLDSVTGLHDNLFVEQAQAFSLAKINELDRARRALTSLCSKVRTDASRAHILDSSEKLKAAIDAGLTHEVLDAWTLDVARVLGIEELM